MDAKFMEKLLTMSTALSEVYGAELERIVLYGSYARGKQTSESDVDIALFLNGADNDILHERMTDLVVDYELELGVTLSVVTIDNEQYLQWKDTLPYYRNISKEGIALWKAA